MELTGSEIALELNGKAYLLDMSNTDNPIAREVIQVGETLNFEDLAYHQELVYHHI